MQDDLYIIAEIGINHNGDIDIAKKLIRIAAAAGCDAVKFQKRNPDVCVPEHQKGVMRDTPWGEMTYLQYKHCMEFDMDQYEELHQCCIGNVIEMGASCWDLGSLEAMHELDHTWTKLASACITNLELVDQAARLYPHVIMSCGMSTLKEISKAYGVLLKHLNPEQITLLHCNSAYPAQVEDLNLCRIQALSEHFPGSRVGYSGHEFGLLPTMASVLLGARCLERHITLDRTMWGTDQMASVEPHGLFKLVKGAHDLLHAQGTPDIGPTEAEEGPRKKLRG